MNIIISGASRGIGYYTAYQLALHNNHKILALSRNREGLQNLDETIKADHAPAEFIPFVFDINHLLTESQNEFISKIYSIFDQIDIIINNAGAIINKPFKKITPGEAMEIYQTNVFAPAELIRSLLPLVGKKGTGHIVNIGSMGGVQGSVKFPGLSYYSSSKAAIAGLTECLAEEYKEQNIAFNCLALGAVQTEMLTEAFPGLSVPTQPEEMAKYISDFALKGHRFFNGKILPVANTVP